ncbi:MAG: EAL domain-containing protein [Chromatiales bacterium]|nr:EAL domain-containing protein [Chromatiales bacterium]
MNHSDTMTRLTEALSGEVSGSLDLAATKISVDLCNLEAETSDAVIGQLLEALRERTACDAAALLELSGNEDAGWVVESVRAVASPFAVCNPEVLTGHRLSELPWIARRLEHLRLVALADSARPDAGQESDAALLSRLRMAAVLGIAFCVGGRPAGLLLLVFGQPVRQFHAEHQLLLKLLGSSLAAGLGRLHVQEVLGDLAERDALMRQTANDGVWDFDAVNGRVAYSRRWKEMMGYIGAEGELDHVAPDWRRIVHPDDLARLQARLREHLAGRTELFESVHRMRRRDGEWRWVQCRARALVDENGRLRRLVGVETDITEQKVYEEALFREKESAQITLQSIGDGVVTTDEHSIVEYINPVAEELTGWKLDDAMGRHVDEIFRGFHEETCEPVENPLAASIRRNRSIKSVRPTLLIRRDGNELYVESTASPIRNDRGDVTGGVLVFHDVSEARELNRRLSYHASHDLLTGLVNRREFESRLERALKSARARETSYALCYLDIDQFKIINDSCGHGAGDTLLGQIGALLRAKIRWRDTLSRLGGDEFGLLLESCSLDEALRTAESLREAIREHRFSWDERTFRLGVSIGVVPITNDNETVASLLNAADSACQAAKEAGRNRIHCYRQNDIDLMRRRREMQWAARINNALEENRFELYRQTIMPLQQDEGGTHFEVLLRMRDEGGALVSPGLFISAAERYGLISNIDRWVVDNTIRWLVSDTDERERLVMCSINLSGQSLVDNDFLPYVIRQFQLSGLDPRRICFEITETAAIASYAQASRFIHALKELGCRFALDDFGTGLSSFGYLKNFPVDYLKIDGSFVKEILHDPIDREMVRSINEIGHLTGKKTIAEFAENAEIITTLRGMGVDFAQGYGVAEPERVLMSPAANQA